MSVPVDNPVLNHERPVQQRIVEFPFVEFICPQAAVRTEGAWLGPSLDDLVAFMAQWSFFGALKCISGCLVYIEKFVAVHVTDIDISYVFIHHPLKILYLLFCLVNEIADIGQSHENCGTARGGFLCDGTVNTNVKKCSCLYRNAAVCRKKVLPVFCRGRQGLADDVKFTGVLVKVLAQCGAGGVEFLF